MGIKYFSYFRLILNDFIINFNCYVIIMNEAFDERKDLTVLQNFLLPIIPFSVAFSK